MSSKGVQQTKLLEPLRNHLLERARFLLEPDAYLPVASGQQCGYGAVAVSSNVFGDAQV